MKNNNISESKPRRSKKFLFIYFSFLFLLLIIVVVISHTIPLIPAILVYILCELILCNVISQKYRIYSYANICGLILAIIISVITVISLKVPIVERIWNWPM